MVSKKELREDYDFLMDIVVSLQESMIRLVTDVKLIKLNKEAEMYDIEFTQAGDMFNVYKEWVFYTAFHSLDGIRKRFTWYKSWIGDITVTICDDCIDSCLECAKYQEEWEKVLSSKKK